MRFKREIAATSSGEIGPRARRIARKSPRVIGPATLKLFPFSPSINCRSSGIEATAPSNIRSYAINAVRDNGGLRINSTTRFVVSLVERIPSSLYRFISAFNSARDIGAFVSPSGITDFDHWETYSSAPPGILSSPNNSCVVKNESVNAMWTQASKSGSAAL